MSTEPVPDPSWVKLWESPKGNNPVADYARSMGLEVSAYKCLCRFAKEQCAVPLNLHLTPRWDQVEKAKKIQCYRKIQQQATSQRDIQIRSDLEEIVKCLNDKGILEHFAHAGWYRARESVRKRAGKVDKKVAE